MGTIVRRLLQVLGIDEPPPPPPRRRLRARTARAVRAAVVRRQAERRYLVSVAALVNQVLGSRASFLSDLGQVYTGIGSTPESLILERFGVIGTRSGIVFRELSAGAHALEPPPGLEHIQCELTGWIAALESACSTLIHVRVRKDRGLLRDFRQELSAARRRASQLQTAVAPYAAKRPLHQPAPRALKAAA
jgi:hypothetical protein